MKLESLDIASLVHKAQESAELHADPEHHCSQFIETILTLFDENIDYFVLKFTLKDRSVSMNLMRQSLTIFFASPDGADPHELHFEYDKLSQPPCDETEKKHLAFLMHLFKEVEKLTAENQCKIFAKQRTAHES